MMMKNGKGLMYRWEHWQKKKDEKMMMRHIEGTLKTLGVPFWIWNFVLGDMGVKLLRVPNMPSKDARGLKKFVGGTRAE